MRFPIDLLCLVVLGMCMIFIHSTGVGGGYPKSQGVLSIQYNGIS